MNRLAISVVLVALAATFVQGASAHTYAARTLSDVRVGSTRSELVAQKTYSAAVISTINKNGRWRYAPRHKTCWNVPWAKTCNQVRLRLYAHRWLYGRAVALERKMYPPKPSYVGVASSSLYRSFICIHRYEGAWSSNTGNGYYGGLQMDYGFMRTYGSDYMRRWGTANNWPASAQIEVAERAYASGRGFGPWPNTARACGLL